MRNRDVSVQKTVEELRRLGCDVRWLAEKLEMDDDSKFDIIRPNADWYYYLISFTSIKTY